MSDVASTALAVLIFNDVMVSAMVESDSKALDQALEALRPLARVDNHLYSRLFSIRKQIAAKRGYGCCRCGGWNGVEYQPTYTRFMGKDYCRDCFLDLEEEMR